MEVNLPVCRNWRAVCRHRFQELRILPHMLFSGRLPMLLISDVDHPETRNLYSLPDGQVYDLRLPVPYDTRCIGSSHGWLIFLESVSFVVTLFNPFYFGNHKGTIYLPPFLAAKDYFETNKDYDLFPEYYITKAVLSIDPVSSPNYTVMLIHGEDRSLAYYNSGDENWTCVPGSPLFSDLLYSNGRFTAVSLQGELYSSNPETNSPELERVTGPLYRPFRSTVRRYIAYDRNKLLQAVRTVEFFSVTNADVVYRTRGFMVFMLMFVNGIYEWIELEDIGDAALFVGDSYSYCVKASSFPGIIPNSVYFTDDFSAVHRQPNQYKGPIDAGIYMIGDGSLRSHYNPDNIDKHLVPPIWIMPTL
ncbi:hypothetical protein RND81_14G113700 [Saponaria officinalis]|uniref:KIB1-4 beta-propeller domain-containing protein n=1 Tax=Saponaria officinalis TaxID=3572 RepID=A0AAW1GPJ9_SAPOF